MDSNVGLAIQCVGVLLITLLSIFMRSSIKSTALRYWTASWASLSLSLISLFIGFQLHGRRFYSGYLSANTFLVCSSSPVAAARCTAPLLTRATTPRAGSAECVYCCRRLARLTISS